MLKITRTLAVGLAILSGLSVGSCGGDSGGALGSGLSSGPPPVPAASNVASVVVDAGPVNNSVNTLFTTVTVCVPGSNTCQTIDHIQVDTGSYGLRILAPVLSLIFPVVQASDGNALAECTQFVDGYSWGPVSLADVQISGETATSVPIQVIGASTFPTVPATCSGTGTAEDTVAAFGANGILGVGVFEQDCGSGCAPPNTANGYYYSCTAAACAEIAAPLTSQVLNPVTLFATDNNGTIIDLPAVAAAGAATVTGALIFGIDTQTNNASGNEIVLNVDANFGDFTTIFNGQTLTQSFLDTGTNGIFFNDSSLAACTDTNFSGFYCPASTQTFTATLMGANNTSTTATFSVGNAQTLATGNPTFTAFPTLAGAYSTSTVSFDWGLPFYYGRRVATAIETRSTSVGTGPYVAF